MAIKINDLELNITSNVEKAVKSLEQLKTSLKGVKKAKVNVGETIDTSGLKKANKEIQKTADMVKSIKKTKLNLGEQIDSSLGIGKFKPYTKSAKDSFAVFEQAGLMNKMPKRNIFNEFIGKLKDVHIKVPKATKVLGNLFKAIKRIAVYRAIRTFIKAITSGVTEGINNLVRYEAAFRKIENANKVMSTIGSNWLQIKNTMGAVAITILNALIPTIEFFTEVIVNAVNAVNHFMTALQGGNQYAKATKANFNYARSIGAIKKQLFGFDELNVLTDNTQNGGARLGTLFEPAEVSSNVSELATSLKEGFGRIKDLISENLAAIEATIGGFATALGLIMLISGNIPLGLGLLAIGLASFAIAVNTDGVERTVVESLSNIMRIAGSLAFAIGLVFATAGMIPLGLGIMAAGAGLLGSAIAIDYGLMTGNIKETLTGIMTAAGGALLAIGLILALSGGGLALGIGLMLGGASLLGTAAAINWDELHDMLSGAWDKIKGLGKTVLDGVKDFGKSLWEAGKSWIESLWQGIKDAWERTGIGDFLSSIGSGISSVVSSIGSGIGSLFSGFFADGGFPTTGQLFIANEAGPELVGQVGNRTAVTNQDQFVAGLSYANESVVQATLAIGNAIVSAINSKDTTIQLDGATVSRQIYRAMGDESSRRGISLVQGAN